MALPAGKLLCSGKQYQCKLTGALLMMFKVDCGAEGGTIKLCYLWYNYKNVVVCGVGNLYWTALLPV